MLRTTKNMKDKYEQIQSYLFSLIPEKWEDIYLYASVNINNDKDKKGELFFYYQPKGLIKKKMINVYEVPQRFNINEEQYLKIVEDLYNCIKSLQKDFIDTEQELWTNVTISIHNFKFKVEYFYDEIPMDEEELMKRNVIWRYKYLGIGGDDKKERKILDEYYTSLTPAKKEIYETGIYLKTDMNWVGFDKEENSNSLNEFVLYEKDDITNMLNKTKTKFSVFNKNKEDKENKKDEKDEAKPSNNSEDSNNEEDGQPRSKNQILNN